MKAAHSAVHVGHTRRDDWRPPNTWTAAIARLRSARLDRELAGGVAPWHTSTHAARALQLTGRRNRAALARSLERLVAHTETPRHEFFACAVIQPCRPQVREALPEIHAIVARLREPGPIRVTGAARLQILLTDGAGACYRLIRPDALTSALADVSDSLDAEE